MGKGGGESPLAPPSGAALGLWVTVRGLPNTSKGRMDWRRADRPIPRKGSRVAVQVPRGGQSEALARHRLPNRKQPQPHVMHFPVSHRCAEARW